jgi:hypothetical protein
MLLLLLTLSTQSDSQCDVVIGSFQGDGGWDMTNQCTSLRAKILDPANFGAGGTFPVSSVTINDYTNADVIDATLLASIDILFIPWINDAQFTAAELTAIQSWVDGGTGVVVGFCDDPTHDAVAAQFGFPVIAENVDVYPTGAGTAHTTFDGCFGTADTLYTLWNRSNFTATAGGTILGTGPAPLNPKVIEYNGGSAIFVCDIDIVSNNSLYITPGSGIVFDNDRFAVNLIEWAIREVNAICQSIICNPVLPVELTDFSVGCTMQGVEVEWETASEINNDFYTIERSSNGTDFYQVATIDGGGKSSSFRQYSWTDHSPESIGYYYRLKQTDYDGNTVELGEKSAFCLDGSPLTLYPNPVSDQLFFTNTFRTDLVEILDVSGRKVMNVNVGSNSVDVSSLPAGLYLLNQIGDGHAASQKFIKK